MVSTRINYCLGRHVPDCPQPGPVGVWFSNQPTERKVRELGVEKRGSGAGLPIGRQVYIIGLEVAVYDPSSPDVFEIDGDRREYIQAYGKIVYPSNLLEGGTGT